jgi:alkylation response protein AidB-like acyl-CoA dehydrogenase
MLDYSESAEVGELRHRLRTLVREYIPESFLGAFTDDPDDLALTEAFCRALGEQRLLTLAWPPEFGGGGASVWEQTALREEMWAVHEPRGAQYMGVNWVGPTIMRHGTVAQHERFLPEIARGEVVWCQGFSEPEAGSDLPALRTRAEKVDGGWRIQGQKVWTSYAGMAKRCFLLARTGTQESRKDGITVFLLDMDQAGIEVRPIPTMLGPHHLNEVYFDGPFVPDENVLGEIDGGWRIISDVLAFERVGIARYARCERLLREAPIELGEAWSDLPQSLRHRWAAALVRARQARLLAYRVVGAQEHDGYDTGDGAAYRIAVTTLDQEVAELLAEMIGNWSLGTQDGTRLFERAVEDHWRYSQASTVASGTLEIQKQTLAKTLGRS